MLYTRPLPPPPPLPWRPFINYYGTVSGQICGGDSRAGQRDKAEKHLV